MDEKSEECDSCGFETTDLKEYPHRGERSRHSPTTMWLCFLCAHTPASNAYIYPSQYEGQHAILRTLCYVGNEILKAIKEIK